ncbi:MAG: N-acetylmuramoyl-L-alanine amidase [Lachnospiraceae bacterium]
MAYKIVLDAGHGGKDPGAVYEGRKEKDDVLRLTMAVGEILENHGFDVEYTRTTDVYESPFEKAMEANRLGADFFVSIHRNAFPTPNTVSGVEVLVYDKTGAKYQMAQSINEQLESQGFVNLGVKERPNLVVLKRTKMPAVLVEAGFIDSDIDNKLFDQNFNAIAQGIADGILDTLSSEGDIAPHNYSVQVGAYRNKTYAQKLLDELLEQDYPAFLESSNGYYRVQVGSYPVLEAAVEMEQRLKKAGYPTIVVG